MDWTGAATILPLGATGFAVILMAISGRITVAMWRIAHDADARYRAEVIDHHRTEQELDGERERRRKAEDKLAEMMWEVRSLKTQVARLEARVAELEAAV